MSRRSEWVDVAKGLGIVLVVHGHVARGLSSAGLAQDASWLKALDRCIYMFHMPLFFFLAGLFFWHSRRQRGDAAFLGNKLETIVYPYLIWSLIQGGLEVVLSRFTNGTATWDQIFAILWLPRAQFWFLYSLFLIVMLSWLINRRDHWLNDATVLGLGVWMFIDGWRLPQEHRPWLVTAYFVYFAAGICASRLDWERVSQHGWALRGAAVAGLAILLAVQVFNPAPERLAGWQGLSAALGGATLVIALSLLMGRRPGWVTAALRALGQASMAIYLLHVLVGAGVRTFLVKVLHIDNLTIHLLGGVVLGVAVPWWVHRHAASPLFAWMFSPPRWLSMRRGAA